jgi:hypothetical protein
MTSPERRDARAQGRAPFLGVGVGLRPPHYAEVLERGPRGELGGLWFEVISENFMVEGGRPLRILEEVRGFAPVALHGVSLNLGSIDPIDFAYVDALGALARRFEPVWVSDHLCWTGFSGRSLHDLAPLPHTEEALRHAAARIRAVQDRLGRRIAVENVSTYVRFAADEMSEWEFLAGVAEEADCAILLDVNNVFVNAWNHGFDARAYLDAVPAERVWQIHLAGHSTSEPLLVDTHDHPMREEVLALYEHALRRLGPVSTLVEWDDRLPSFGALEAEAARARRALARATDVAAGGAARRGARDAATEIAAQVMAGGAGGDA